ncbi:50S ribosomal protein L11 methyltransferase [Pedobacter duraquae]|uniref:Ribosomal protein L11 methyltransferase n=1 Tax=Pedobacter duraquae TaxID=425511 RepID=A0A4R6IPY8_9SPHI|nr:50S ribosomal protein L11 methyltransferase [Pedobacter duraquae]TDO24380.1 ribosomal protein L11 methyltransferase [Pedobacter duraquae]
MEYIQLTFSFVEIADYQQDLLIDELANIGYNTFEDTDSGFAAFISFTDYSLEKLDSVLLPFAGQFIYSYTVTEIAGENWNEAWEKNFEPLIIDGQCYVRATFHESQPQYPFEIVVDPKMAFGTGHHQTTTMMMSYILREDMKGQSVLDMGCGTGILAILASKRGAAELVAIDNDEVCYQSTLENTHLNEVDNIDASCGGKEAIPKRQFNIILANINRNILLDQIETYNAVLVPNGQIFFSGFYETPDLDMIKAECARFDISYKGHQKIDDWVAAHFVKN